MKRPLYQHIASRLQAIENCEKAGNTEWLGKHRDALAWLVKEYMPSGGGIDNGTSLYDKATDNRLVFGTMYHHMNEGGYYDGWTDHTVIVTPSLTGGIDLRITGRDRNDIKEYLHQVFFGALTEEIEDNDPRLLLAMGVEESP
jgi:hypothetical protein